MKIPQSTLWYLYDFANSFASIVVFFYFPLLFVSKGGFELWMGIASSVSTLALMFVLPGIARRIDRTGKRIFPLIVSSVGMSVILGILGYAFWMGGEFGSTQKIVVVFLYGLFFLLFNGSVSIYTSLLRTVSPENQTVAISGKGMALGQLWNVVGLAALSPIISSGAVILGLSGKPVAFIFGAVASIVFAIPFFLMSTNGSASATLEKRTALSLYKKIYKEKHVFYFLIGMMLVSDAILTFQTYVSIFIKRTYAMDDQAAVNVATIGLFFCLVGGMVSSWAVRKSANIFRALMSAIFLYSACFAILAVIPSVRWMVFVAIAVSGLAYWLVFTIGRVVYAHMTPKDEQTSYFGIYTLFERTASVIGPLLWAFTFLVFQPFWEAVAYRASVLTLGVISLAGLFVLRYSVRRV